MKYTVNWVEKNLGVTRKALRIYEEKGLMDKCKQSSKTSNFSPQTIQHFVTV